MLDDSSDEEPFPNDRQNAEIKSSVGGSPCSSPSARSDENIFGQQDGYPYHDYLTDTKNEPYDGAPPPKATDVLGIKIKPGMNYLEKKKMYEKLMKIKEMGPVYNPWLSTYQRHIRWSEHLYLVDEVLEELKFKPPFISTEANRQRCREYKAIVEKVKRKSNFSRVGFSSPWAGLDIPRPFLHLAVQGSLARVLVSGLSLRSFLSIFSDFHLTRSSASR